MIVIPAIDLSSGKVIRLRQGKMENKVVYSDSPRETAQKWVSKGARLIHLVDLDAALGIGDNTQIIKDMITNVCVDIQVGGGIRSKEKVEQLLNAGAKRVVLGTKVFRDKEFFKKLLKEFKGKIVLALDIKDNKVAVSGWQETVSLDVFSFIKELQTEGLEWVIYTDVSRDGMLGGINFQAVKELSENITSNLIISGGVGSASDIEALSKYRVWGVIIGKALYEEKVDLEHLIKEYQNERCR